MSTTVTDNENMPLFLGLGVVVIILIAFFTKGEEASSAKGKKKAVATPTAAPSTTASKKSKKKKSASKAKTAAPPPEKKAEKKVVIQEPPVVAEPEPEAPKTSKKKKKKPKKKSAATAANSSTSDEPKKVVFADDDDDESDDDLDLWRIQSGAQRKGATDATKRIAANKERDRIRALKRQEEKTKAEATAAAEVVAAAGAAAEAEALTRKEKEDSAMQAALAAEAAEEEKKKAEVEAKAKKNGASVSAVNGDSGETAPAVTGEKKKRKRKKKKNAGSALEESARPVLVKPAAPSAEQWETVPMVEEWQEVVTTRTKQKAKMDAAAEEALADAPFLSDEPVDEESGETSVIISAGDDPLILIGRGGSTIQNLQDITGASFHLDRITNLLTISGSEDCVQHGLVEARAILAIDEERKANEAEERVTWGSDAIKAVIGRGGANIRATQEATGVRIDADVDAGTLVIVGPADDVSTALTMCHNAAFGEVQDVLELGSRNAVNLVYGPSFQTIRSLQDTTGCKLDITRGSTTVKLAGSSEEVAEAITQIRALLEANRGFEMTIENSKVGAVYGKGGETLRSIQDRTGTQIDVSRGPTHANVSVMGTADASARARNMLQRAIDGEVELQPGDVAEEVDLGAATAAVIGRGGSNVTALEKKHVVKINVRSELQKARVVGKPDNVEAAVKDITAIAQPILDAEKAQKKADEALESGESAWQVDTGDDDADGW